MAERRMFAKTIIDSDAFLDMPLSTQSLYFHLCMRADDDGFINNPKKIQRMVGASDDDLKLLIAKKFIIPFESGIIVIKHWKIHNYIQKDRYKETAYVEEKAQLLLKPNNSYTLAPDEPVELEDAKTKRHKAYAESNLPYSFDYKIRQAFIGKYCPVCGCLMNYANKLTIPTIQHNIPLSKGGRHEIGNISIICASCNKSIRANETDDLNAREVAVVWNEISCIQNVSTMDTQNRIDKTSIDNNIYNGDSEEQKPDIETFFETIWKAYPKKRGKGSVSKTQKQKLYKIGLEEMLRSIERYKAVIASEKTDKQFVMYGSSFFNTGYVDYLDKNFETDEKESESKEGIQWQ